eukprot:TRINITY_DN5395_c0_g1_i1.p2 TRINITY_DN5395_c0_g1~~TRINITY_DN5395_c0_g1_i1.p2  ORF type:complete len:114 (+),score=10.34 TRINITY_DN5395_c0_g1_i1:137-478(+)
MWMTTGSAEASALPSHYTTSSDVENRGAGIHDKDHSNDVHIEEAVVDGAGSLLGSLVVHQRRLWAGRLGKGANSWCRHLCTCGSQRSNSHICGSTTEKRGSRHVDCVKNASTH